MPIPPDNRAPGDSGHITDHHDIADELTAITAGAVALAGDLTGTAGAAQVTGTHLGSPLPLAQGGTGQTAQAAALTALAGTQSAGKVVRSDGTNTALASLQAGDVPTLNQSTTGTAAGLSATLPVASGGTGQTSAPNALNALGGAAVAGDIGGTSASPQVTGTHLASALPVAQGGTGSTSRNFAGLLTPTAVKTSAYTLAAGDFVPCDTTSGNVPLALPNAPADLAVCAAKQVIQGTGNKVTVACSGSDVFNKVGGGVTATLDTLAQGQVYQYKAGSPGIWYITADDLALSQMDVRYLKVASAIKVINALDYGCVADGTTDNSTAINNMLTAAAITAGTYLAGGSELSERIPLYFPTGASNYAIKNNPIALPNYCTIYGDGVYNSSIKQLTVNVDTIQVNPGGFPGLGRTDSCTTSTSVNVTDTLIQAADLGKSVTGSGIPANTVITSVTPSASFVMSNASSTSITTPLVIGGLTTRTDAGCVLNGTITVGDTSGAVTTADIGKSVTGTFIPANTQIATVTPGTGFTLSHAATGSATETLTISLFRDETLGYVIRDISVYGAGSGSGTGVGINVFNSPQIRFERVRVTSCGSHGVQMQYSWDLYAGNCIFGGNGGNGMEILNQVNLLNLVSCMFVSNTGHGFHLRTGAVVSISNGDFESNGMHGCFLESSFATTVTSCDFENNNTSNGGYSNLFVGNSSTYDIGPVIFGNNFSGATTAAYSIVVDTAFKTMIYGNEFSSLNRSRLDTSGTSVTAGNTFVGDTNAVAGDVDKFMSGIGIQGGTYIVAVVSTPSVGYTVSLPPTITGTPNLSIFGSDILINSGAHGTWIGPNTSYTSVFSSNTNYVIDHGVGTVHAGARYVAAIVPLTDASTIAIDASQGNRFRVTLGASRTLGNPTNLIDGQDFVVEVTQAASGGPYTLAFGTNYAFSTDLPSPTITITASATDLLYFTYNAAAGKTRLTGLVQGF